MSTVDPSATAQSLLRRAFVLTSFAHYQEAIACCDEAEPLAEDPLFVRALKGSLFTASGRPLEAMRLLIPQHRAHPDHLPTALHLAEACFLAGRSRRAWKILDSLPAETASSAFGPLADSLRTTWELLERDEASFTPLVVPEPQAP